MTMPHERTRSLRWAYETLQAIRDGAMFSDADRASAATILIDYPTPEQIIGLINAETRGLPLQAAFSIDSAGALLRSLWCSNSCSVEMRDQLHYTLRHYPEEGHAALWARDSGHEPINEWLLIENHYAGR